MARTLGVIKAKAAVEPLIKALGQPEETQPKPVFKAAIDALGEIGDPAAVDVLISVQFAVADTPVPSRSASEPCVRSEPSVRQRCPSCSRPWRARTPR